MKIIISRQNKKLLIEFNYHPKLLLDKEGKKGRLVVDNYLVDKSEGFLLALDKFFRKHRIRPISPIGHIGRIGHIKFSAKGGNTGMLTERVVRAILKGLYF